MAKSTKPRLRRAPNKLTAKALRFAHEYAVDLNATKAAERAGYSKRTASAAGHRLLRNVEVEKLITAQTDRHIRRVDLRAEDVLRSIMQMASGDIPSRTSKTTTDEVVTEVEITDRLKALGLLAQHFDLLKSKLEMHHTGPVGLLEAETLRHMSDEKLSELKAHVDAVFEIMGQ